MPAPLCFFYVPVPLCYRVRCTGGVYGTRGQELSPGLLSGNRAPGSNVTDSILRPPKSSTALNVLLPLSQTSTGHVTIAVFASTIFAFFIGWIAGPVAANLTCRMTGDGMPPASCTDTVVRFPLVVMLAIDPSTDSVVNNQ